MGRRADRQGVQFKRMIPNLSNPLLHWDPAARDPAQLASATRARAGRKAPRRRHRAVSRG